MLSSWELCPCQFSKILEGIWEFVLAILYLPISKN